MKSSFHFSLLGHNASKTHSFTWHLNRQELAALDINGYSNDWLLMWDFMIRTELQSPENSCPTQIHSFFIFMFSPYMKMENQYLKIRVIDIAQDPRIPFLRLQTKWQWKHARPIFSRNYWFKTYCPGLYLCWHRLLIHNLFFTYVSLNQKELNWCISLEDQKE